MKVNGDRTEKKVLQDGDIVTIGKRVFTIQFEEAGRPSDLEEFADEVAAIFQQSLLEKAGLVHPPRNSTGRKSKSLANPLKPQENIEFGEDEDD